MKIFGKAFKKWENLKTTEPWEWNPFGFKFLLDFTDISNDAFEQFCFKLEKRSLILEKIRKYSDNSYICICYDDKVDTSDIKSILPSRNLKNTILFLITVFIITTILFFLKALGIVFWVVFWVASSLVIVTHSFLIILHYFDMDRRVDRIICRYANIFKLYIYNDHPLENNKNLLSKNV